MMSRSVHISQKVPGRCYRHKMGNVCSVYRLWSQITKVEPGYSVNWATLKCSSKSICATLKKKVYLISFYLHPPCPTPYSRQLISCWYLAWKQQKKMSCQKYISKLTIISVTHTLSQCVYLLVIVWFLKVPKEKLCLSS